MILLLAGQIGKERQPDEAGGKVVRVLHGAVDASVALPGRRGVERHIVEDGMDAGGLETGKDFLPIDMGRQQDVIHMRVMDAFLRDDGAAEQFACLQTGQGFMIAVPEIKTAGRDFFRLLKLGPEKGRDDLSRQIG